MHADGQQQWKLEPLNNYPSRFLVGLILDRSLKSKFESDFDHQTLSMMTPEKKRF